MAIATGSPCIQQTPTLLYAMIRVRKGMFSPPSVHLPAFSSWMEWIVEQRGTSIVSTHFTNTRPFLIHLAETLFHFLVRALGRLGSLCMSYMLQTLFQASLGITGDLDKKCLCTNGSLFPGRTTGSSSPQHHRRARVVCVFCLYTFGKWLCSHYSSLPGQKVWCLTKYMWN